MNLRHLQLEDWPFQVVPDARSARIWGDREDVKRELAQLLRSYARTSASSVNLVWAYFGAGKTHFLRHFAYLMESQPDSHLASHYSVFPRSVKGYLDMYRVFAHGISAGMLANAFATLEHASERPSDVDAELLMACRTLVMRPDLEATVMQWFQAGRPLAQELRAAGLRARIDTAERAVQVQASAVRLLQAVGTHRFVWMIDEFQRIGELRLQQKNDVNVGLHSIFNELPSGFSLMLSFSFGEATNIRFLLSDELLDRANLQPYFQLPPLGVDDSVQLVTDVLRAHRDSEVWRDPTGPFREGVLGAVIRRLDDTPGLTLKPRTLMQVFDAILSEADLAIEEGVLESIDQEFAIAVFQKRAAEALFLDEE
jgi:hypothetical protein